MDRDQQNDKDEFTDSERAQLQALAKEREHRRWLMALLKRWATFTSAVVLGASVLWDALGRILKALSEHGK